MILFRRICGWVALSALFITIAILGLFAKPTFLFAHKYEAGGLTLYADVAQNSDAAKALLSDVSARLTASPLGAPETDYTLYSTKSKWREALFFGPAPKAGGVVYPPLAARHSFLTGIDPKADRLHKGTAVIQPPRTLSFYMVHELTHLHMYQMAGTYRFYRMPHWVREGVPDYVALGPLTDKEMAEIIAWDGSRFDLVRQFGAYPVERAIVSYAIAHLGIAPKALMSTDMTMEEALRMMRAVDLGGAG